MKLSVIVSTYNRPDALDAVLHGFTLQHAIAPHDWEILIADDGSTDSTRAVVDKYRPVFGARLQHVWHADQGFRLAEIRNLAASRASGDFLIFLDGDCIPLPDFLAQQLQLAEPGWVIAGNRILLSEPYTAALLGADDNAAPCHWGVLQWLLARLSGKANKSIGWLRLAVPRWRRRRSGDWRVLRGCNIGVYRRDFLTVDGFDASFSGWGHEDSDFAVRLLRAGVRIKDGRFAVPVVHLWHRENDRSQQPENWAKFEATLNGSHTRAMLGLSSTLNKERQ